MKKKTQNDVTVIDYTQEVLNKVNEIYENQELRNKALFILYLINRGTNNDPERGYQLNATNHREIFSFNGVEYVELFKPLVLNGMVECTTPHAKGKASKRYRITNPFKWEKNKGEIKKVYKGEEYELMPKYIQQFHIDKQVVKSMNDTSWAKNYQYISKQVVNEDMEHTIKVMQNQMLMMQEVIELMQIQLNEQNELINTLNSKNIVDHRNTTVENHDIESKPLFPEDEIFDFEVEAVEESQHVGIPANDEYTKFIESKLKLAKIQPMYWSNAIAYIKENKEANPIEFSKLIGISTASSQVVINKIKQYWN